MGSIPKRRIAQSFGQKAQSYDRHAQVQRRVAENLAAMLPSLPPRARILEIGCGTGLLTAHLIALYPDAALHITDIAPEMLEQVREKFPAHPNLRYSVMDGEHPALHHDEPYDLIVSSMCVQWFTDPPGGLARLKDGLKPGGYLHYATIGQDAFHEWKAAADGLGLAHGFLPAPHWPDITREEYIAQRYRSGLDFIREIKGVGAHQPSAGYTPLHARELKILAKTCADQSDNTITWHIVYGAYTSVV